MRFYSIRERQLKAFAAIGGTPKSAEILENLVRQEWEMGSSRPRWCWVAEDDQAQLVARVVFTAMGDEASYVGEYLPPGEDGVVIGAAMFEAAFKQLRADGIRYLERFISSDWPRQEQLHALAQRIGCALVQTKVRMRWSLDDSPLPPVKPHDLTFETLETTGKEPFLESIRRASAVTLDRLDSRLIARMGGDQHASTYLHILHDGSELHPGWWLIARTPSGELAGHVIGVPYGSEGVGSVGYIGVVPEQRGHGYGEVLIAEVMQRMAADGITGMVCDMDEENTPMRDAFTRAGYQQTGTVSVYVRELTTL